MPDQSITTTCPDCGSIFHVTNLTVTRRNQPHKPGGKKRGPRRLPDDVKFWRHVDTSGECWLWTGGKQPFGYGQFFANGRGITAHRFSYELHVGPIPKGLFVCHNCPDGDNPSCVNPAHLFLGTHKENMADMAAKGRSRSWGHPGRKLTDEMILGIRQRYAQGETQQSLAAEFNVASGTIAKRVIGVKRVTSMQADDVTRPRLL